MHSTNGIHTYETSPIWFLSIDRWSLCKNTILWLLNSITQIGHNKMIYIRRHASPAKMAGIISVIHLVALQRNRSWWIIIHNKLRFCFWFWWLTQEIDDDYTFALNHFSKLFVFFLCLWDRLLKNDFKVNSVSVC